MVIDNYPEDQVEELDAVNNPEDPAMGTRKIPFSRVLYVERDDFQEHPPKGFFRLAPGREVRLRYAYFIKCVGVVKDDATGEVMELHCTYDPATKSGSKQAERPQGQGHAPLGLRSAMRSTPRSGCTTASSRRPNRATWRKARTTDPI